MHFQCNRHIILTSNNKTKNFPIYLTAVAAAAALGISATTEWNIAFHAISACNPELSRYRFIRGDAICTFYCIGRIPEFPLWLALFVFVHESTHVNAHGINKNIFDIRLYFTCPTKPGNSGSFHVSLILV